MSRLCSVFSTRRLFFLFILVKKLLLFKMVRSLNLCSFWTEVHLNTSPPKTLFFTFVLFGQKLLLVFFLNRSSFEHKYLLYREVGHGENSSQPLRLAYCSQCVSAAFIISRTSACLLGGTSSQSSSISRIAVISFSSSSSRRR